MKLLDVLSKRKQDESIEHIVNPVYDTAKNCLANLTTAHCNEAIRLNEVLHFASKTTSGNAVTKGTSLFQEVRYQFVNEAIRATGIRNVLDIGCGYSPRGILLGELGYNYTGADLPAAIRELEPAVMQCMGADAASRVRYLGVDATNPDSLLEAAEGFEGPVCIVSEGLMMYFPIYELAEYVKGIRGILEAHGGCVITPDFCMNRLLKLSSAAFAGKTVGNILQAGATKIVTEYYFPTDSQMDPSVWYADETDDRPYEYFTSAGFCVERTPIYQGDMELNMLSAVKASRREKLIEDYRKTFGWILTLA